MGKPRCGILPDPTRRRPWPLASAGRGLLFAHLLLSPLLFSRHTVEAFEFPKAAFLWFTAILLAASGLSAIAWELSRGRGAEMWARLREEADHFVRDPLTVAVSLVVAAAFASTVASMSPRTSLRGAPESYAGLSTVMAYAILFFATRILCRTSAQRCRLLVATVNAAFVAAAYALIQAARLDPLRWDDVSGLGSYLRPFSTMGHANFLAAFLAMAWPVTLWSAGRAAGDGRHAVLVALVAGAMLELVAIILCMSRGGWLALGSAVVVLALGWARSVPRRRLVVGIGGFFGLAIGLLVLVLLLPGGRVILAKAADRACHWRESDSRLAIWRAGLATFGEHPCLGNGLDTFQLAFPRQRTPGYWRTEWGVTPARAHNGAVQVLATEGLVGALAATAFTLGLLFAVVCSWRRAAGPERPLVVALAGGVVAFYVQNLFSFTVIGCGSLFITLAALLPHPVQRLADGRPSRGQPPARSTLLIPVAGQVFVWGGAVTLVMTLVLLPLAADCYCRAGDEIQTVDPSRALACYELAVSLAPAEDRYWSRLGGATLAAAGHPGDRTFRPDLLRRARDAFARAEALVPCAAYHHDNLGQALARGARQGLWPVAWAFQEFDAALAADPVNVYFHADAASAALLLRDPARARSYAERGLALYADFAPLKATLAYAALLDRQPGPAERLLRDALACDWFGDDPSREAAAQSLRRLGEASMPPSP